MKSGRIARRCIVRFTGALRRHHLSAGNTDEANREVNRSPGLFRNALPARARLTKEGLRRAHLTQVDPRDRALDHLSRRVVQARAVIAGIATEQAEGAFRVEPE